MLSSLVFQGQVQTENMIIAFYDMIFPNDDVRKKDIKDHGKYTMNGQRWDKTLTSLFK